MIVALRVWGRELPDCRDVVVHAERDHTVGDLCAALAEHLGIAVPGLLAQRTLSVIPSRSALTGSALASGDVVIIGTGSDVVAEIIAGPDTGHVRVVGAGRSVLGRGTAADVAVDDPTVSRHHADLQVGPTGLTLTPIGAVRVNGSRVESTVTIEAGDVIAVGRTEFVLRAPTASVADNRPIRDGGVEFRRTPYRRPVISDRGAVTIGPIPERHDPRRMQMLSIAGPLLAGLVLFAFMHRVEFLALTLLSPVLLVASTLDDRRAGRRGHKRQIAAFRSMLDDRRRQLADLRAAERAERLLAAPDLAELTRRAEATAIDLWPRGRDAADVLLLRVGTGSIAANIDVVLAAGGEQRLRDEAAAAVEGATVVTDVPIMVDLAGALLAVHGDTAAVDGVVTSLAVQAACLHVPEALAVVAAIGPERGSFEWIKWLPHARSRTLARSRGEAESVVRALLADARLRATGGGETEPHVLAVFDAELLSGVTALASLLELAPLARIGILWIAKSAADVPHHASSVLEVARSCRLWSTLPGSRPIDVDIETADSAAADRVARALAPVRDIGGDEAARIPAGAGLLDVIGCGAASSTTLTRWWHRPVELELRVAIGVDAGGPVVIDLVADGPHMLIAGTTGSGKSELLQSAVMAIAARYSPQRVNFFFVDYKGGAATHAFEHLPHTVGYVTNLDAVLARRAIVSLRAELERRMTLLEGRAKDLRELLVRAPDEAPPCLVIVIDEFATLAKQLPDFVAGVVDVAQRGRSLGIHLVVSTQRLAGAVDENIVANTNVRVALRVLDRADSTAMVGDATAAEIPAAMHGRGVCRIGSNRAVVFQSGYGGRPLAAQSTTNRLAVSDFTDPCRLLGPRSPSGSGTEGRCSTQQQAVLDAVVAAANAVVLPPLHRPWREPLRAVVTLDELPENGTTRAPVIGMLDAPEVQQQGPLMVDLERGGGCLVFGSGGSGRTTALRSLALAVTRAAGIGDTGAIVAFDGASRGLASIAALPTVVDVAAADDLEAITRHIDTLDRELARRRRALSDATAEDLSAYNAICASLPRIVVLIDDIGALVDSLGGPGGRVSTAGETWSERLVRVLVEGRQAGIHGVVAADRRGAVPSRLLTAVSNRIVLGFADRASYADHGVPSDAPVLQEMTPGRGWWNGATVIQLAVAAHDHSARGQLDAITCVAASCNVEPATVLRSTRLPARVALVQQPHDARALTATIGVEDLTGADVTIDLTASHVAVVGHPRSGRSTALCTIAAALSTRYELVAVGTASSGLAAASAGRSTFGSTADIAALLEQLATGGVDHARPTVLLVDDLDLLDDIGLARVWDRVAAHPHLRIVAAVGTASMTSFTSNPVAAALKRARQMLVLQPDDPGEFLQLTGTRFERRPGVQWTPGRGVLCADRATRTVQIAAADGTLRRTPVRSRDTVCDVNVLTNQSLRTAAVVAPARR